MDGEELALLQHARNARQPATRFVSVSAPTTVPEPTHPPSRRLIWLLTLATGASVALRFSKALTGDALFHFRVKVRNEGNWPFKGSSSKWRKVVVRAH